MVLYCFVGLKIFKGDMQIPMWLSPAAQDLLRKILEPNPMKRINISGIKEHEWFLKNYIPAVPYDDEEDLNIDSVFSKKEVQAFSRLLDLKYF